MLFFLSCVALLLLVYFTYGLVVEKVFSIDPERKTCALELADGVDEEAQLWWSVRLQ
jgi:carbon starvation protein CstA